MSLSTIAAKDGAGSTVAGGIQAMDKSGAGTGPFALAHAIIDSAGTNVATVKAASTAPVASDPALVVAISPNGTNANVGTNADGVAAAGSNVAPVGSYNFVFNGTTWDRLKVGTAGTSAAQVLTVQGIASATPVITNQTQINGSAVPTGSGTQAGVPRTTLATDSPGIITLGPAAIASSVPMSLYSAVGALGSYNMGLASGTMAAGLTGASPIVSFRYGGANKAIIRRIWFGAGNAGTAFTAGVAIFNVFAARSFTASDTGGTAATLTTNNGKMATAYGTTAISDFRVSSTGTLTAGTRTLDATALRSVVTGVLATAGTTIVPYGMIYDGEAGIIPLQLAQNEGFVIQATVPATGTWTFGVNVEWDEVSAF